MDKEGKSKENKVLVLLVKEDKKNKKDKEDKGRYDKVYDKGKNAKEDTGDKENKEDKLDEEPRRRMTLTLWQRGSEALERVGQEVLKPRLRPTANKDFVNTTKTEILDRS